MKKNIGTGDRIFRMLLGVVIIILGLTLQSWWGLIGIIPIFTALSGWCGLYSVLGISTCRVKSPQRS